MEKTHAMRVLDARGIAYTATVYDSAGAFHSGAEAAAMLGADVSCVFKTLVVLREEPRSRPLLVMVPAAAEVDLKLLAADRGAKKLRMATLREAEGLTGMQAGGISALGLRQLAKFDVLIDAAARGHDRIHISAGRRGYDLEVALADLMAVTGARWCSAVAAEAAAQ